MHKMYIKRAMRKRNKISIFRKWHEKTLLLKRGGSLFYVNRTSLRSSENVVLYDHGKNLVLLCVSKKESKDEDYEPVYTHSGIRGDVHPVTEEYNTISLPIISVYVSFRKEFLHFCTQKTCSFSHNQMEHQSAKSYWCSILNFKVECM